jgi:hypothetical protein
MYKALRVPISLLHQKIYDTSVRLEKRVALVPAKKEVTLIEPSKSFYEQALLIGFYTKNDVLHCRACNKPCVKTQDRTEHYLETCRTAKQYVMGKLWSSRKCSVCSAPISMGTVTGNPRIDRLPVCGLKCAEEWNHGNPENYVDELVRFYVTRAD